MSNEDGFLCEMFTLKTIESRKVISFFHISAVNFIVGCDLLVSLINGWVFSVTVPKKENVVNETLPLVFLRWIRFVSVSAMWILAKDTDVFLPNATPWV